MPLRVDAATGATTLYEVDLRLPGVLPLELARSYRSTNGRRGPFGYGWSFNLDVTLHVERDRIIYRDASDREIPFRAIEAGVQVTNAETGCSLQHHPDAYVVYTSPLIKQVFLKQRAKGAVYHLDQIEDAGGRQIALHYEGARLVTILDTEGRRVQCTYAGDAVASLQVGSADGGEMVTIRSFRYDAHGDLEAVLDEARRETRYVYQDHLMVAYTNRLGGTTYAQYGPDRRCLTCWHDDGSQVRRLAYDDLRQITRVQKTDGRHVLYRHFGGTHVQALTDPTAAPRHYQYDAAQRLSSLSTEGEPVAVFQQADAGTFIQVDGEERIAIFTLNALGLAESVEDGNGNAYTLAYDEAGRLVRVDTPAETTWTFARDAQGRVIEVASPEERRVRLTYGKAGRTLTVADDLGVRYEDRYDLFGRLVERSDALGRRQQCSYDPNGRLTTMKLDAGYEVRYTYDAEGHLTGVTDSRHRNLKFQYDTFGRMTACTGSDNQRRQFQYDADGRLVSADVAGKTAHYAYDDQDRLVRYTAFDGGVRTYCYDADSDLAQHEPNETAQRYSSLLDLLEEKDPAGGTRRFTYGPSGELTTAVLPDGEAVFAYDAEGRLATVQRDDVTLTLAYDGDGILSSVTDENGTRLDLQRDARGRIEAVQVNGVSSCRPAYDDGDRLTALDASDGKRWAFSYDGLDRLEERSLKGVGDAVDNHRFRTKETELLADELTLPADAAGEPWGTLYQCRHGLLLAARFGTLELPIWMQPHLFAGERTHLDHLIVGVVLDGVEAGWRGRTLPSGLDLLRQWTQEASGVRHLRTEVPSARDVAMPWRLLDQFFLRRVFFDASYPQQAPWYLAHHQDHGARSSDPVVTGSHMTGVLKPPAWRNRIMHLDQTPLQHAGDGLGLDGVMHLVDTL